MYEINLMKRIKSIDIIRGFAIVCMFLYHIQIWWIKDSDLWITDILYSSYAILGTTGFLFISGVSTMISYRNRLARINETYTRKTMKNEYFLRALFILITALLFNIFVSFTFGEPTDIWKWFILLTIAFSLFMSWPFLKISKTLRITFSVAIWIFDQFLVVFLVNFQDEFNFFGVLYYILYNSLDQDPILTFLPFFLIGTVIGDLIYEVIEIKESKAIKRHIKKKILTPCLLIGTILVISGIIIQVPNELNKGSFEWMDKLPDFLNRGTLPWMIFALGFEILLISILFSIEEFEMIKNEKSYRFLFYFSYYSFTTYLIHNLLYFLFLDLLNIYNVFIITFITLILFGLLLKLLYKKLGGIVSLKVQIGRLSAGLAKKIDEKKYD